MTKPYYADEWVTLFHGDCLEIDEWLSADVLVTDPPYGVSWSQHAYLARGHSRGGRTKQHDGIQNDADTTVRDGVLALWGDRPALVFGADKHPPSAAKRTLIWKKPNDAGFFGVSIWRRDWEPIYVLGKWPQAPATESSVYTSTGSHRNYAQGIHPHAKPIDLLERLIAVSPPGGVADPFAGSGSTLVAAKALGRRAIGVEIEERYCETAARRLAQDVLDFEQLPA